MSAPDQTSSNPGWRAFLTHPVTVGVAIWLFVPVGIVLLLMNPSLRKDRRWWAGAAAWVLYLLWVGRLPLTGSGNDNPDSVTVVASSDADATAEEAAPVSEYFPKDPQTLKERAQSDKAFTTMLSEADTLWQQQDTRPDALEKYVFLLDTYCGHGKGTVNSDVGRAHQADLARVAVRAIDALVESGNTAAAKKLIVAADQQNLTLVFRNPKSDALVPKAIADREREDREAELELERMQRQTDSDSAARIPSRNNPRSPTSHEEKMALLSLRVRPGMTLTKVMTILGAPDETSTENLADLNPGKRGQRLTLATWHSPSAEHSTIMLSFINDRLSDGGTVGGYRITNGASRASRD